MIATILDIFFLSLWLVASLQCLRAASNSASGLLSAVLDLKPRVPDTKSTLNLLSSLRQRYHVEALFSPH